VSLKENIKRAFENGLINTAKKIKLINKQNNTSIILESMSKASTKIGKNKAYISCMIKRNIYENDNFKWECLE
jgi:hypothetical protein